jgi:hypothetical protein
MALLLAILLAADLRIACQTQPTESKERWSFRLGIEGNPNRCWFKGHHMEKSRLYWRHDNEKSGDSDNDGSRRIRVDENPVEPDTRNRDGGNVDPGAPGVLRLAPEPEVAPLSEFEDRWSGLNECRRPANTTGFAISDCRRAK